jgi:hypothetical protein
LLADTGQIDQLPEPMPSGSRFLAVQVALRD